MKTQKTMAIAAAKAGMDEKKARKYLKNGQLPSQCKSEHTWCTRSDPFDQEWEEIKEKLDINPGLEAKTLFEALQREKPGKFSDGQLRTLQRRIKVWRATKGPPKEVFFPQQHYPGQLCASDFTDMNKLGITIEGLPFKHLIYHFVLTYSNWETGTICFSESYESLSEGFQNALWELGGVPQRHRTDRLSAAVH
ncbi:MAG: transposase family protein, partial [archaeon]|nr:transposase family protein [archaeon]